MFDTLTGSGAGSSEGRESGPRESSEGTRASYRQGENTQGTNSQVK